MSDDNSTNNLEVTATTAPFVVQPTATYWVEYQDTAGNTVRVDGGPVSMS